MSCGKGYHLSIYISIYFSIHLSIYLIQMPLVLELVTDKWQHPNPKLFLEEYWADNNNIFLYNWLVERETIYLSIYISIYLSIYSSELWRGRTYIYLPIYISIYLSLSTYIFKWVVEMETEAAVGFVGTEPRTRGLAQVKMIYWLIAISKLIYLWF